MGISIGGVEVGTQIIDNEFRIGVLERVVDLLSKRIPVIGGAISKTEVDQIRREVFELMEKKYPDAGLTLKG